MKRAAAILAFALAASLTQAQAQDAAPARIEAIRAQLFYERTGTLSEDLPAEPALWNTIIGGGEAGQPSTATLITVEISGRDLPYGAVRALVSARGENDRVLAERDTNVSIYDEGTRFYVPLWLNDTGCEVITMKAQLVGVGADSQVATRIIPFRCGE